MPNNIMPIDPLSLNSLPHLSSTVDKTKQGVDFVLSSTRNVNFFFNVGHFHAHPITLGMAAAAGLLLPFYKNKPFETNLSTVLKNIIQETEIDPKECDPKIIQQELNDILENLSLDYLEAHVDENGKLTLEFKKGKCPEFETSFRLMSNWEKYKDMNLDDFISSKLLAYDGLENLKDHVKNPFDKALAMEQLRRILKEQDKDALDCSEKQIADYFDPLEEKIIADFDLLFDIYSTPGIKHTDKLKTAIKKYSFYKEKTHGAHQYDPTTIIAQAGLWSWLPSYIFELSTHQTEGTAHNLISFFGALFALLMKPLDWCYQNIMWHLFIRPKMIKNTLNRECEDDQLVHTLLLNLYLGRKSKHAGAKLKDNKLIEEIIDIENLKNDLEKRKQIHGYNRQFGYLLHATDHFRKQGTLSKTEKFWMRFFCVLNYGITMTFIPSIFASTFLLVKLAAVAAICSSPYTLLAFFVIGCVIGAYYLYRKKKKATELEQSEDIRLLDNNHSDIKHLIALEKWNHILKDFLIAKNITPAYIDGSNERMWRRCVASVKSWTQFKKIIINTIGFIYNGIFAGGVTFRTIFTMLLGLCGVAVVGAGIATGTLPVIALGVFTLLGAGILFGVRYLDEKKHTKARTTTHMIANDMDHHIALEEKNFDRLKRQIGEEAFEKIAALSKKSPELFGISSNELECKIETRRENKREKKCEGWFLLFDHWTSGPDRVAQENQPLPQPQAAPAA